MAQTLPGSDAKHGPRRQRRLLVLQAAQAIEDANAAISVDHNPEGVERCTRTQT